MPAPHPDDVARHLLGALTVDQQRASIEADAARIAEIVEAIPEARVPSCPDWSVADLAKHVGFVLLWSTRAIREPSASMPGGVELGWPDDGGRGSRLRDAASTATTAHAEVDPSTLVWTWAWGSAPAGFWSRRLMHELAIHRVDAELAADDVRPVVPAVAADGIDELLTTHLFMRGTRQRGEPLTGDDTDLHVHLTDVDRDGEWHVELTPTGPIVTRAHRTADVAIRGRSEDALLWLWRRRDDADLELFGADADVAAWRERLAGLSL